MYRTESPSYAEVRAWFSQHTLTQLIQCITGASRPSEQNAVCARARPRRPHEGGREEQKGKREIRRAQSRGGVLTWNPPELVEAWPEMIR